MDLSTRRAGLEHHAVSMFPMRFQASRWDRGVLTGGADACTLGGAKAARWGRFLCMLVLAHANARRSMRQMRTFVVPLARAVNGAEMCQLYGPMRLSELYRTSWLPLDGADERDVERYTTTRLEQNVRYSQIYGTYAWTRPRARPDRPRTGVSC